MKEHTMDEMKVCGALIKRNVTMFFKDKGTFFTSLATPMILLLLYTTFLSNVYEDSFRSVLSAMQIVAVKDAQINGLVGGLLLSSLLAVSAVTVPFCANLFMVQDRVTGARADLSIAPIKSSSLALGYYLATVLNGLIICFVAIALGLIYLAVIGWYLSIADILLLMLDVVILVLFGTALSSLVCYPLNSQGAMSAVGSIVSSCYGFLCGAYMPISSFSKGLQNALAFFPGTYGTSLVRNHALSGVLEAMAEDGVPTEAVEALQKVADCKLSFFDMDVDRWVMYLILVGAAVLLLAAYVLIMMRAERKKQK